MGITELKDILWQELNSEANKVVTITHSNLDVKPTEEEYEYDDDDEWDEDYILDEDDIVDESDIIDEDDFEEDDNSDEWDPANSKQS